jgi:hypothetical protein
MIHAAHNGYTLPMHPHHRMPFIPPHMIPPHMLPHHARGHGHPWAHEVIPSPCKGSVSGTPCRNLNYSIVDSPASVHGGRTLPHPQRPAAPATSPHLAASPQFASRLERELQEGTKEDLIKLIVELCTLSNQVHSYVESKAQLFALRPGGVLPCDGGSPYNYTESIMPMNMQTPLKQSEGIQIDRSPQSPLEELTHDLENRHCKPEEREFSEEVHPCLRMYAYCRYPTSCIFRHCPRNLCLNFLRGDCSTKECPLVHRIPRNASPEILHMISTIRGESVPIPDEVPSSRELFNASGCSDVANQTLDEEGHKEAERRLMP